MWFPVNSIKTEPEHVLKLAQVGAEWGGNVPSFLLNAYAQPESSEYGPKRDDDLGALLVWLGLRIMQ